MTKRSILICVLFGLITLTGSGCAVALVGAGAAGTVAYLKGDLESVEPYSVERVFLASKEALKDLHIFILEESRDILTARVRARDSQDEKITIKIDHMTYRTTKLRIRVSTFGDETKSQRVYLRIRQNLQRPDNPDTSPSRT